LRDIRAMEWNSRRVAKVGASAGAGVFWCSDGEAATIVIGHDDETLGRYAFARRRFTSSYRRTSSG
jgi:hypothetical protein